jgi:hypothetical protein
MIPFKLGKIKFNLPQSYDELSFDQFIALRKSTGNIIEVLSILSGVDEATWKGMTDLDLDVKLLPAIDFLSKKIDFSGYLLPDKIKIGEEFYPIPDIRQKTFGQKLALQRKISEVQNNEGDEFDIMTYAVALYFQPAMDNSSFDETKVEELLPIIGKCKAYEVIPVATFFLRSWQKSLIKSQRHWQQSQAQKRSGQESMPLISSEHLQRFTPLRRALIRLIVKFYLWITILSTSRYGTKKNFQDSREG